MVPLADALASLAAPVLVNEDGDDGAGGPVLAGARGGLGGEHLGVGDDDVLGTDVDDVDLVTGLQAAGREAPGVGGDADDLEVPAGDRVGGELGGVQQLPLGDLHASGAADDLVDLVRA